MKPAIITHSGGVVTQGGDQPIPGGPATSKLTVVLDLGNDPHADHPDRLYGALVAVARRLVTGSMPETMRYRDINVSLHLEAPAKDPVRT